MTVAPTANRLMKPSNAGSSQAISSWPISGAATTIGIGPSPNVV
jgi:hypothetical protein